MWNKTKEYKVCNTCKQEFPRTEEYFFKKIIKDENKNGVVSIYKSYRSSCKKCYNSTRKKIKDNKTPCTTCKKCGTTYDDATISFPKSYKRIDGTYLYGLVCKNCNKLTRKKPVITDKNREYMREWITNNKDKIKESRKRYREKNRDIILKREKEYRDKNPNRHRLGNKNWQSRNKCASLKIKRNFYQRHKERICDEGVIKRLRYKYGIKDVPEEVKEIALNLTNIRRALKQS